MPFIADDAFVEIALPDLVNIGVLRTSIQLREVASPHDGANRL